MTTCNSDRPTAVIGGGTLGRRIALMMTLQGGEVRIYDKQETTRGAAVDYVTREMPNAAKKFGGKVGRIVGVDALEKALDNCWIAIEAVPEILDLKISIFGDIEKLAPNDAILASNSSSYASSMFINNVSAEGRKRVVNTHFYMPPNQNAVEVGSCGYTDTAIIELLMRAFPKYGVTPFLVRKESTGFIFNRVWAAIKRECLEVVATGVATIEDVDGIFKVNIGGEHGPFQLMDQVGLDVVYDIETHYARENPNLPEAPRKLLKEYIDKGWLGIKAGRGFYNYGSSRIRVGNREVS